MTHPCDALKELGSVRASASANGHGSTENFLRGNKEIIESSADRTDINANEQESPSGESSGRRLGGLEWGVGVGSGRGATGVGAVRSF